MSMGLRVVISLILFFAVELSHAQSNLFKFPITETGIYKITASEANSLGVPLNQIAFYGFPGMLPQELDSIQLRHQEIPSQLVGNEIWVFLVGPHQIELNEGTPFYTHHIYSDTLHFLIGKSEQPKRVDLLNTTIDPDFPSFLGYQFTTLKGEKVNLLNSGRTWYSDPIRAGQSLNFNVRLNANSTSPWLISGKLMTQSINSSTMRILTGDTIIEELAFDPIPNTTYGIKGQEVQFQTLFNPTNQSLSQIRLTFQGQGGASAGYLDYLTIGVPVNGQQVSDGLIIGSTSGSISLQSDQNAWEVSDFYQPKSIGFESSNGIGTNWFVFKKSEIKSLTNFQPVLQKAREVEEVELLIITHPRLQSAANRLLAHKKAIGISAEVLTTTEIFDGFGYGNPDLTAIRNFIATSFHKGAKLQNVLILGKGTFDYKGILGGRPNLVPIYTSRNSLNPLNTYSSDDYFGLLDWGQGKWEESREGDELMQIGIGRIPAITLAEANSFVDKLIAYESREFDLSAFPSFTVLADDGDNGIHMRDSEAHANFLRSNHPEIKVNPLFLDRFEQTSNTGRQSSEEAKKALEAQLDQGTFILNYVGHGNETTLTAEEIFTVSDIDNWANQSNPALWVTATCEFGRHDSPFIRSAAEELLIRPAKGAIGLLTTGRPVFSSVNFSLNQAFVQEIFNGEFEPQNLGEVFKKTKNNSLNGVLNRNFSLLGDPSLRLPYPELNISIKDISEAQSGKSKDTLSAFQPYLITAEIIDPLSGALNIGFNGNYKIEIRGEAIPNQTLGDENSPFDFLEEKVLLFQGSGMVSEGILKASIKIPGGFEDLLSKANIRILAWNSDSKTRALGLKSIEIKDEIKPNEPGEGPQIQIKVEDKDQAPFVFSSPRLTIEAHFSDPDGIQISGLNPEQNLEIKLNNQDPIILNENFVATNGSFSEGKIEISLDGFEEGLNTIEISAWDILGNGNSVTAPVEIRGSNRLQILTHKVFPNPSSIESHFEVTHNRPGENINLTLEVFSLTGKILFSETKRFVKASKELNDLSWIFFQTQTNYPAKGTYIYKLSLESESDNTFDSASGKLVIQ